MDLKSMKKVIEVEPDPPVIVAPTDVEWKRPIKTSLEMKTLGQHEIHNTLREAVELLDKAAEVFDEISDPSNNRHVPFETWAKMMRTDMDISVYLRRLRV